MKARKPSLSWLTILRKREGYRAAFARFDPQQVARFDSHDQARLLNNPDIVRNRLKIAAAIQNARHFLDVQEAFGSFDQYLWHFVDGRPINNHWHTLADLPASTPLAEKLSKDLQRRGFRFAYPTICYSLMQAVGLVNDHLVSCFRHGEITHMNRTS